MEQLLYLLCILIVIIMGSLMYQKLYVKEGFASSKEGLRSCPLNMKHYYDSQDNSSCCDGRLEGGVCIPREGVNRSCVLGLTKNGKASCRQVLQDYYKDMGAEFCPKGLNYYEGARRKGCTGEPLTGDLSGPVAHNTGKPECRIYPTEEQNRNNMDSCQNMKAIEDVECRGTDCVKTLSVVPNSPVPLVLVQFTDMNGSRHSCYTDDSYSSYKTSLKTTATVSENPFQLCSAAYAKFLDRKEV